MQPGQASGVWGNPGDDFHPYDDVEQIVLTSHERSKGSVFRRANLHLRFRDGRSRATDEMFVLPRDQDQRRRLAVTFDPALGIEEAP